MGEMPLPRGVGEEVSKWLSERHKWENEGGFAPESVIRDIDNAVSETGFSVSPEFRADYVRAIRESYDMIERQSAVLALNYLYFHGQADEWPVKLSEICAGPFVELVESLARVLGYTDQPILDPLGYVKELGQHVVEKLKRVRWIQYADTPGADEYTPGGSHSLTAKGREAIEFLKSKDPNKGPNPWKEWD